MVFSLPLGIGGAHAAVLRAWEGSSTRPLLVAISGGIGSGKTTFSKALRPFAAAYADADELAREVVMPGTPGLHALVDRFGPGILDADGQLNRQRLAELIFNDPGARTEVEHITHPLIGRKAQEILQNASGGTFAVYDVPLIRNALEAAAFDVVIMVTAPEEERISRLVQRGLSREDAQRRIDAQISDEVRRELASVWVMNAGSAADLEALAEVVATTWLLPSCK